MKTVRKLLLAVFLASLGGRIAPILAADLRVTYLHHLSDFTGTVPYSDVRIHVDRVRDEVYAVTGGSVRVFNGAGMEIYEFDPDPARGTTLDLAVDEAGNILLLTVRIEPGIPSPEWSITRCDFRGEVREEVVASGLPPDFESFVPNGMLYRDGRYLLISRSQGRVAVIDRSGVFRKGYDLARLAGVKDSERASNEVGGFGVDRGGSLLFTIPTLFRAFVVSPEGGVRMFGRSGSSPGAFGIVAGIAADDAGNYLVADMNRGVVLVFGPDFEYRTEFGASPDARAALVRPTEIAVGESGKVYVTQARDRGVAVFRLESGGGESPPVERSVSKGETGNAIQPF
jgi:DNA-binding beta-propeller fold protein YncE